MFGKKKKSDVGDFAGFALLSEAKWSKAQFIADMKSEWNIDVADEKPEENDVVYAPIGSFRLVIGMMPAPIPDGAPEHFAHGNYMWRDAVETVKSHKAHLLICILGDDGDILEKGRLYVMASAAVLKQESATAFYQEGAVYEPEMYLVAARMLKSHQIPLLNWVWFGLYNDGKMAGCYTYGMRRFGKEEMEVYVASEEADLNSIREFVISIATYVIDTDATLRDGETIGFSEEQKLSIRLSKGILLEGKTLKITYGTDNTKQLHDADL